MDRDHAPFTLAVCFSKKGSEKGCVHRGFDRLLDYSISNQPTNLKVCGQNHDEHTLFRALLDKHTSFAS